MATCHQCNSEISDADAFCPYCGISLTPVEIPSEEDEFASTIMMTPEMASKSPSAAPNSEDRAPKPVEVEPALAEHPAELNEPPQVAEAEQSQDSFERDEPPTLEEIPYVASQEEDIPTPALLEDFEEPAREEEPLPEEAAEPKFVVDDPVPTAQEKKEEPAAAEEIDFGNAPTEYAFQVPAYEEPVVDLDSVGESETKPSEPVFEAAPQIWPEPEPQTEVEIRSESAPSQPEAETAPEVTEDVISKPAEVLEMPDPTSGPAMFDSVRIMDDRMTPTGVRPAESSPASVSTDTPSSATGSVAGSSRFGTVDTDGRRGAKLKPL